MIDKTVILLNKNFIYSLAELNKSKIAHESS